MNHGTSFKHILKKKTILITGASGCIGGRLVERLCRDFPCRVHVLVSNTRTLTRISRHNTKIWYANILDKPALFKVTKGIDYVVHCAVGNTQNTKLNHSITVNGTKNILEAALNNNVQRIIYLSSTAVYGYPLPSTCDESMPYKYVTGDYYNNDKIAAEKIARSFIKRGAPIVIIQPTLVYGPYAKPWTVSIIKQIKSSSLFLIDQGNGYVNPIYIDNLIDALFLALTSDRAVGERFIVSDGIVDTWRSFFGYFQNATNQKKLSRYSPTKAVLINSINALILMSKQLKNSVYPKPIMQSHFPGFHTITEKFHYLRKETMRLHNDKNAQEFFSMQTLYKIEKAKKLLGYNPRISLERGMRLTKKWARYMRL